MECAVEEQQEHWAAACIVRGWGVWERRGTRPGDCPPLWSG